MAEPFVLYERDGRVARITLNRPEQLNAIHETTPDLLRAAVERANQDDDVHVILLSGTGRAFCAGYDLKEYAEAPRPVKGSQDMPWIRWWITSGCGIPPTASSACGAR